MGTQCVSSAFTYYQKQSKYKTYSAVEGNVDTENVVVVTLYKYVYRIYSGHVIHYFWRRVHFLLHNNNNSNNNATF